MFCLKRSKCETSVKDCDMIDVVLNPCFLGQVFYMSINGHVWIWEWFSPLPFNKMKCFINLCDFQIFSVFSIYAIAAVWDPFFLNNSFNTTISPPPCPLKIWGSSTGMSGLLTVAKAGAGYSHKDTWACWHPEWQFHRGKLRFKDIERRVEGGAYRARDSESGSWGQELARWLSKHQ